MKALNAFIKPFEAPQSVKIKIYGKFILIVRNPGGKD